MNAPLLGRDQWDHAEPTTTPFRAGVVLGVTVAIGWLLSDAGVRFMESIDFPRIVTGY